MSVHCLTQRLNINCFFKVSVYKRLMLRKEIFFFTKVALFYTILSYHLQPTVLEASRENLSSSLTIFFSVVGKVNKCIYIRTYICVLTMLVVVWAAIFTLHKQLTYLCFFYILVKYKSNLRIFSVYFTKYYGTTFYVCILYTLIVFILSFF